MRTGGKHRVTESHTVVTYIVAVHDALFTCVVMDAAAFNAGWGLGQEMARAGGKGSHLRRGGPSARHIFSIFFHIISIFFVCLPYFSSRNNIVKILKNMEKYENQYGKIQ